jgi:hypothetical protein
VKSIDVDQLRAHLDDYLAEAAREDVVVTLGGKPWVILRAAASEELEDNFADSPEFWEMIQRRRAEPTVAWDRAKSQLALD